MALFPQVTYISECYIKPKYEVQESKKPYYLSPFDQIFLALHYNQKGLLFAKPKQEPFNMDKLLESLKDSLALTLVHFYPLAGQLDTVIDEDQHKCLVFVDCNKGPGVRFTQAKLDMTVSDITTPRYTPEVVKFFYDHQNGGEVVCYDGHSRPLLSIQVTELVDGVFIGCSMNHAVLDGTSSWHFWNVWSEIQRDNNREHVIVSRPPIHTCWVPEGYGSKDLFLPFTNPNEFIFRFESPQLVEAFFQFSSETISKLKSRANQDIRNTNNDNNIKLSSLQSLTAFIWTSIIRAKRLQPNRKTRCKIAANSRSRLHPPLPETYFGNAITMLATATTVGKLLEQSLGKTALMLHQSVASYTNEAVHDFAVSWFESPHVYRYDQLMNVDTDSTVQVVSSPRFNIYGNEFAGIGKPVAVRSGLGNKFGGKVIVYPGREGGGSVGAEICLPFDCMRALECNDQFMAAVSSL